jgi:hypothetical protein
MITVNRGSPFRLLFYWKKPVTGGPGRYRQNHRFIVEIEIQDWLSSSPESYGSWFQGEKSGLIASLYTNGIIQIPIAVRHTGIPCLRPAVSSLGACPTPAL